MNISKRLKLKPSQLTRRLLSIPVSHRQFSIKWPLPQKWKLTIQLASRVRDNRYKPADVLSFGEHIWIPELIRDLITLNWYMSKVGPLYFTISQEELFSMFKKLNGLTLCEDGILPIKRSELVIVKHQYRLYGYWSD